MHTTTQKAAAEFIGTLALIFVGAGSVCANKLAGGGIGLVGIALAHGLTVAVMVSAIGHISGGHINPAVTLGAWIGKKISDREALYYVAAQLAGGIIGAVLLLLVFREDTWRAVQLGSPMLAANARAFQGILAEFVLTFLLVFTVFATALDERGTFKAIAGFGIGMVVTFGVLAAGPLTGAALNPARAFGPALVASFWKAHLIYWVGPLAGGALAGWLYTRLFWRPVPASPDATR